MSEPTDYSLLKAAALTSEELERRVVEEMRALNESGAGMRLELHPAAAFAIVAFCQLALRHPQAAEYESAANVKRFIEYVRAKFEPHAPAIALAIERGNDPEHDTPRDRDAFTERSRQARENIIPEPEPATLFEFLATRKEPATPEDIQAYLHRRRGDAPPLILTCPYCGNSQIAPSPLAKVDIFICAKCGRTVETA